MDENLRWLLDWFNSKCDGQWELGEAFAIGTLDNPGWCFWIRTEQTELQNQNFQKIRIDRTEDDWVRCYIEEGMFKGCGGPFNLSEVLQIFRNWAEGIEGENQVLSEIPQPIRNNLSDPPINGNAAVSDDNFSWLLKWFHSQCNGDWEHCFGVGINNIDGCDFHFEVDVNETELYDKPFQTIDIRRSDSDWIRCSIDEKTYPGDRMFVGDGSPFNLSEMIKIFRDWAESAIS